MQDRSGQSHAQPSACNFWLTSIVALYLSQTLPWLYHLNCWKDVSQNKVLTTTSVLWLKPRLLIAFLNIVLSGFVVTTQNSNTNEYLDVSHIATTLRCMSPNFPQKDHWIAGKNLSRYLSSFETDGPWFWYGNMNLNGKLKVYCDLNWGVWGITVTSWLCHVSLWIPGHMGVKKTILCYNFGMSHRVDGAWDNNMWGSLGNKFHYVVRENSKSILIFVNTVEVNIATDLYFT